MGGRRYQGEMLSSRRSRKARQPDPGVAGVGAKEPRRVRRWDRRHSYWKVEAGGSKRCLRCFARSLSLYLGSGLCVRHRLGDVGGFNHRQRSQRQRATFVGFTPAFLHTPTTCEPPVAALGRTGPKTRGRVGRPFVFLRRHPQGSHFPNPTSGFQNQVCALSGLGGLQPNRGSRGGFWARALPACGCVLSVIDSPASRWLFFFFFPHLL